MHSIGHGNVRNRAMSQHNNDNLPRSHLSPQPTHLHGCSKWSASHLQSHSKWNNTSKAPQQIGREKKGQKQLATPNCLRRMMCPGNRRNACPGVLACDWSSVWALLATPPPCGQAMDLAGFLSKLPLFAGCTSDELLALGGAVSGHPVTWDALCVTI